jgi:hypothetical protein
MCVYVCVYIYGKSEQKLVFLKLNFPYLSLMRNVYCAATIAIMTDLINSLLL